MEDCGQIEDDKYEELLEIEKALISEQVIFDNCYEEAFESKGQLLELKLKPSQTEEIPNVNVEINLFQTQLHKKSFSCCECGKTFTRAQNWKIHVRIHSGKKAFSLLQM